MSSIFAIAKTTFKESIRGGLFSIAIAFMVALVLISSFFGTVTIGERDKVIKNLGLCGISILSTLFAIIAGSSLLHKELTRRTILNILAKPVSRLDFIVGKFIGMVMSCSTLVLSTGIGLVTFLFFLEGDINLLLLQGMLFICFELLIVCAGVVFFSTIVVTPALTGIFALSLFITGRSASYLLYFVVGANDGGWSPVRVLGNLIYSIVPHLDSLYIANQVTYGHPATLEYSFVAGIYSIGYASILLCLAHHTFVRREFH